MAERNIDSININIGANLSQLKSQLTEASQLIRAKKFPKKVVEITVKTNLILSDAEIKRFQGYMGRALAGQNGLPIPVKATQASIKTMKSEIKSGIGTIIVPIGWAWDKNGPPPTNGGGGGAAAEKPAPKPTPAPAAGAAPSGTRGGARGTGRAASAKAAGTTAGPKVDKVAESVYTNVPGSSRNPTGKVTEVPMVMPSGYEPPTPHQAAFAAMTKANQTYINRVTGGNPEEWWNKFMSSGGALVLGAGTESGLRAKPGSEAEGMLKKFQLAAAAEKPAHAALPKWAPKDYFEHYDADTQQAILRAGTNPIVAFATTLAQQAAAGEHGFPIDQKVATQLLNARKAVYGSFGMPSAMAAAARDNPDEFYGFMRDSLSGSPEMLTHLASMQGMVYAIDYAMDQSSVHQKEEEQRQKRLARARERAAAKKAAKTAGLEGLPKLATGGPVRPGGLMERMARQRGEYTVAEKQDELFIGESGNMQVLHTPEHAWSPPEKGRVLPAVPAWVARMDKNAKDLTGLQHGGPVDPRVLDPNFRHVGQAFTEQERAVRAAAGIGKVRFVGPAGFERLYQNYGTVLSHDKVAANFTATTIGEHLQELSGGGSEARQAWMKQFAPLGPGSTHSIEELAQMPGELETNIDRLIQTLSPTQRAQAKLAGRENPEALQLQLRAVGIRGLSAQQLSTLAQRSAPLALGQITSTFAGRGAAVERGKLAGFYAAQASSYSNLAKREEELGALDLSRIENVKSITGATEVLQPAVDRLTESYHEHNKAAIMFREQGEADAKTAEHFAKSVGGLPSVVKNFSAQLSGAITGTLLYGGAFTGIQLAIQGAGAVLGPTIDKLSGYQATTEHVTAALADQTKQMSGNAQAAVAANEAQTGLNATTAASIQPILAARAAGEEANANLSQQVDLIAAAHNVARGRAGGVDASVFSTTGGLFGTPLFGKASTFEQVRNMIQSLPTTPQAAQAAGATGDAYLQRLGGYNAQVNKGLRPGDVGAGGTTLPGLSDLQQISKDAIAGYNADIRKAGGTTQFQQVTGPQAAQQISDTTKLLKKAGQDFPDLAGQFQTLSDAMARSGTALVDANGQVITSSYGVVQAFQQIQQSAQRPTSQQLIEANKAAVNAQMHGIMETLGQQLSRFIPSQQALEFYGNRPLPYGTGITAPANQVGTFGPTGSAGLADAITSVGKYSAEAGAILKQIEDTAQQGDQIIMQRLASVGAPTVGGIPVGSSPVQDYQQYKQIGATIAGVQTKIAQEQAGLELTEYNHQLYITTREYKDALGLAGKLHGANSNNLGVLQRETFELGKQSEALALQLQQRQINFQVAVAGFTAPGLTSEERAAREKEALVEAAYAQKQLNISKQQYGVGIKVFDVGAVRQVQDLAFALKDLERSHKVAEDTKAASQYIALLQTRAKQLGDRISAYLSADEQKVQNAISYAVELETQTGEAFSSLLKQTASAWSTFLTQGSKAIAALVPGYGGGGGGGNRRAYAGGGTFMAHGRTDITVGEAAGEYVAVLRNPQHFGASGGGGASVVVNITGNHVRSDADLRELKVFILRTLNDKAALTGLRNGVFG